MSRWVDFLAMPDCSIHSPSRFHHLGPLKCFDSEKNLMLTQSHCPHGDPAKYHVTEISKVRVTSHAGARRDSVPGSER